MTAVHKIIPELLTQRVQVALVGCGGNGSQMLTGLARLHVAMMALGHPGGLHVTAYDFDLVSPANIARQLFYEPDIGQNKATVLVERVNRCYGLDWESRTTPYVGTTPPFSSPPGLLITCVDTAKARREIHYNLQQEVYRPFYWLDLGNSQQDGQVVFGQPDGKSRSFSAAHLSHRLPTVVEVFPEMLEESFQEDNTPSCSLAEALRTQGLYINDHVSRWALTLLEKLFRKGQIEHCGSFINLESGRVVPVPVPSSARSSKVA